MKERGTGGGVKGAKDREEELKERGMGGGVKGERDGRRS